MNGFSVIVALGLLGVVFGYSADNCGYKKKHWYRAMGWCAHKGSNLYTGDFNGDGQTDILCHDSNGYVWTSLAQADGTFISTTWKGENAKRFCYLSETKGTKQLFVGDFNGDGRSDLLCHDAGNGDKFIKFADAKGTFNVEIGFQSKLKWCYGATGQLHVGDFNGDKKDDILCHETKNGYKWIAFSNGKGFTGTNWQLAMGWCKHPTSALYIGDFNGDGRSDMMCSDRQGRKWISYASSNPKAVFTKTDWYSAMNWCGENGDKGFMRIADVNGDKKDDIICHSDNGSTWVAFALPQNGFTRNNHAFRGGWCGKGKQGFKVGYFNKDDRADIMCHEYTKTGQKWILFSECPFVKK